VKYTKKMVLIILLLGATSANASFTDFEITEVTDTTVSFTWQDNDATDDTYYICEEIHNNGNCTEIGTNIQDYTQIGLEANSSYEFYLEAYFNNNAAVTTSDWLDINTTHTWEGELLKCVNEALGYGSNDTSHTPTKSELEWVHNFTCSHKYSPAIVGLDSVADLIHLRDLDLGWNDLSGSIPEFIWTFTDLTSLNLEVNQFTGSLPPQLGVLTSLEKLNLSNNSLSGSIPTQIGMLQDLIEVYLSQNQFTGSLPLEITTLINLEKLSIESSELTGSIPIQIGALTSLLSLNLSRNNFTGSIPIQIGSLESLLNLNLQLNKLTGSIPKEIGTLTSLGSLSLNDNNLTGPIPTEIGNLTQLNTLNLNNNRLSGEIPQSIESLTGIPEGDLRLRENCNIYTDVASVQTYIATYTDNPYQDILDSNTRECFNPASLIPITTMMLE